MHTDSKRKKHSNGEQIELRTEIEGTNLLAIVGLDGWNYGPANNDCRDFKPLRGYNPAWFHSTRGKQVRFSANQAVRMTIDEFRNWVADVEKAYEELQP